MRFITALVAFVLALSAGLSAQTDAQDPASKSDVRKLHDQLRSQSRRFDEKTAQSERRITDNANRQFSELKEKSDAAQAQVQALAKAEADRKLADEARDKANTRRIYGMIAGGLALFAALAAFAAMRRGKAVEVRVVHDHLQEKEEKESGPLTDPSQEDLERHSRRHGGATLISFIQTLPEQGVRYPCTAELRPDLDPYCILPDGKKVGWKDRKKALRKYHDNQPQPAAPQSAA
jgi:hypothetical protein